VRNGRRTAGFERQFERQHRSLSCAGAEDRQRSHVEDLFARDRRVERPVEVVERLEFAELGRFDAPPDLLLIAHEKFALEDKLQELGVAELMTGRLFQADVEGFGRTRQAQLTQGGL